MKRRVPIFLASLIAFLGIGLDIANAHADIQLHGYSVKVGEESMIWFRIEHGCTYQNVMYPTHLLQVTVPNAAGRPKPEYKYGFMATVTDSKTKDKAGVPINYTVTWKAKNASMDIDGMNYAEFGLMTQWDKKAQAIYMPTIQTCVISRSFLPSVSSKDIGKSLFLKWIVETGVTPKDTSDTEYGPAPVVITKR